MKLREMYLSQYGHTLSQKHTTPQAMKFKTLQEPFLLNITIDLVGIMPQNYEDIYTCILFC